MNTSETQNDPIAAVPSSDVLGALEIALRYGQIDGAHHKAWVIDQMCRKLLGPQYKSWVASAKEGEDGLETYLWDEGIAP